MRLLAESGLSGTPRHAVDVLFCRCPSIAVADVARLAVWGAGGHVDREQEIGREDVVAQCRPGILTDATGRAGLEPGLLGRLAGLINTTRAMPSASSPAL